MFLCWCRAMRVNRDRIQKLISIIQKVNEFEEVVEEYTPYLLEAEELGLIENLDHDIFEDQKLDINHQEAESQEESMNHYTTGIHSAVVSHTGNEDQVDVASQHLEPQEFGSSKENEIYTSHRTSIFAPRTNTGAEIRVYKNGYISLEWWKSGRKQEEVKVFDELGLYRYIKYWCQHPEINEHAKHNFITKKRLDSILKRITGYNTSHRTTILMNYLDLNNEFDAHLVRKRFNYNGRTVHEWCLAFGGDEPKKSKYEDKEREKKTQPQSTTEAEDGIDKELFKRHMQEDREVFRGILK